MYNNILFLSDFGFRNNLVKKLVPIKRGSKNFMGIRYVNPNKLITNGDISRLDSIYKKYSFKFKDLFSIKKRKKVIELAKMNNPLLQNHHLKALELYKFSKGTRDMQMYLINGSESNDKSMQSLLKILNDALEKITPTNPFKYSDDFRNRFLNKDRLLRRYTNLENITQKLEIGKVISTDRVMSTTNVHGNSSLHGGAINKVALETDTIIKIKPKNKTKTRDIDQFDVTGMVRENEFLYPMGSKFRVLNIEDGDLLDDNLIAEGSTEKAIKLYNYQRNIYIKEGINTKRKIITLEEI